MNDACDHIITEHLMPTAAKKLDVTWLSPITGIALNVHKQKS